MTADDSGPAPQGRMRLWEGVYRVALGAAAGPIPGVQARPFLRRVQLDGLHVVDRDAFESDGSPRLEAARQALQQAVEAGAVLLVFGDEPIEHVKAHRYEIREVLRRPGGHRVVYWVLKGFVPKGEQPPRPERLAVVGYPDVEVDAVTLEAWMRRTGRCPPATEAEAIAPQLPKPATGVHEETVEAPQRETKARPRRGRPPGSGSYEEQDRAIALKMHNWLRTQPRGTTVGRAAEQFVRQATGSGILENRLKRLVRRYRQLEAEGFFEEHSLTVAAC